jgi:hypothetical protein
MKSSVAIKTITVTLLSLCMHMTQAADKQSSTEPIVKKSETGICHDKSSTSFGNTKKFTSFASMEECIKNGGRAAAGQIAAAADPVVKKSESGICHDQKSTSYERTKKFTEFKTLDECVKSGGTLPKK